MEMKRNAINPFSDQSDNDSSSSSESEEVHRPEKNLRLKVKISVKPTTPTEEQTTDPLPRSPSPPPRRHFCVVCNKEFSSGKAFGGHVRIHSVEFKSKRKNKNRIKNKMVTVRKNKKRMVKKNKIKRIEEEEEGDLMIRADVEEGGKISCCICGKAFQTKHSLFGHMRRHPDRSWKGIRPPPPPEKKFDRRMMSVAAGSSSSSKKFQISSCTSDLKDDYYEVLGVDDDVTSTSTMEEAEEAAYCLMLLSCDGFNNQPVKRLGFVLESSSGDMGEAKPEVRSPCRRDGDQMGSSKGKNVVVEVSMKHHRSDDHLQVRAREEKKLGFDLNQPYVGGDEDGSDDWLQV